MCGRYGLYREPSALVRRLRARYAPAATFVPHYNIAPTTDVLAITNVPERAVRTMRWGLVPRFRERKPTRRSTFNARIETLVTSALYGPLVPRQRCIVPADGYYEWPRRADGRTDPVWISRRDGATIAFAGLWDGDAVTIVTHPPNVTIARLHDRMPVALEPDAADAWLAAESLDPAVALGLLAETDAPDRWTYHHVARRVGNVRNDDAGLIEARDDASADEQLSLF